MEQEVTIPSMLFAILNGQKHAADAALVVTPYYNKPSDEGIFRHFEACAKVGIPIIVYNIAGRTGKIFLPPCFLGLPHCQMLSG